MHAQALPAAAVSTATPPALLQPPILSHASCARRSGGPYDRREQPGTPCQLAARAWRLPPTPCLCAGHTDPRANHAQVCESGEPGACRPHRPPRQAAAVHVQPGAVRQGSVRAGVPGAVAVLGCGTHAFVTHAARVLCVLPVPPIKLCMCGLHRAQSHWQAQHNRATPHRSLLFTPLPTQVYYWVHEAMRLRIAEGGLDMPTPILTQIFGALQKGIEAFEHCSCGMVRLDVNTFHAMRAWLSSMRCGALLSDACCPAAHRSLAAPRRCAAFSSSPTFPSLQIPLRHPVSLCLGANAVRHAAVPPVHGAFLVHHSMWVNTSRCVGGGRVVWCPPPGKGSVGCCCKQRCCCCPHLELGNPTVREAPLPIRTAGYSTWHACQRRPPAPDWPRFPSIGPTL